MTTTFPDFYSKLVLRNYNPNLPVDNQNIDSDIDEDNEKFLADYEKIK